ncbi:MAG TPA: pantoate--beta-alanine ligase [Candidatus Limnocylindrales bacterium]|nr:pantoate--beta-alanine ligase [Candidatus Limnocylindrales bacterium]
MRTIEWMKQAARQAEAAGGVAGLVPTMGALHEGHLSLVRAARQQCSRVVVSIFVNPKQFGPGEDFEAYPRNFKTDRALLESAGVDCLFIPEAFEIYPAGFCTGVHVPGLSETFEGRVRPGHFQGVATVVLKLFEIVRPRYAYFGRKDAQQARIIRQMAADLNLDAEIIVRPIVRESDGVAMSSRNAYLKDGERRAAAVLHRALHAVSLKIAEGARETSSLLEILRSTVDSEPLAKIDYAAIVDADSFAPAGFLRGNCLVLIAARIGATRLIDNLLVEEREGKFTLSL